MASSHVHDDATTRATGDRPGSAATRVRAAHLVTAAAVWVGATWAAFLLVDAWNVANLRDGRGWLLWPHLFNDGPTEWLQWVVLGALILVAGVLSGRLREQGYGAAARFWLLFGVAAIALLFEDTGDARHVISAYVEDAVGTRGEWDHRVPRTLSDLAYFSVLAAIPLYALLRYGRAVWVVVATRRYLIAGVALYAVAAVGSVLRHFHGLYHRLGERLHDAVARGSMPVPEGSYLERMYFSLMDGPVEESVELLAATCLLAAAVAFLADTTDRPQVPVPEPPRQGQPG